MQTNHKTRNIDKYLTRLKHGEKYHLGLPVDAAVGARLQKIGFTTPLVPGERLLPPAQGPASRRNADGIVVVHRDQPKETAYRQVHWHWIQYAGRNQTEEKDGIKDVPYLQYPRTQIAPYSVEFEIRMREDGAIFVVAGSFEMATGDNTRSTNTANMLMEQIGGFEVLNADLSGWISAPVLRLNWLLLPPGRSPWEEAKPQVAAVVERAKEGNRAVIQARLEAVGEHKPAFVAVGLGGFDGYIVFSFPDLGLCILESRHVNNATYILHENSWEKVSQLSKAQILDANAHRGRIIHTRAWFDELSALFDGARN